MPPGLQAAAFTHTAAPLLRAGRSPSSTTSWGGARPRARRSQRVRMSDGADGRDEASRGGKMPPTLMEREGEEPSYSVWGVVSFGIIFLIFFITILATLARDFVPNGLVGPA